MSKIFDEMKQDILQEYPSYKTLPVWTQLKLLLWGTPYPYTAERYLPTGHYKQTASLIYWNGKGYHYKWGSP